SRPRTQRFVASIRRRLHRRGDVYGTDVAAPTLPTLQFGHGFSAVEMALRALETQDDVEGASIRPRLQRRGDEGVRGEAPGVRGASIRPRLQRRGDRGAGTATQESGECFNSATASAPWRFRYLLSLGWE